MTNSEIKQQYHRDGYLYIPQLLGNEEVEYYRKCINRIFNLPEAAITNEDISNKTYLRPDAITNIEEFWPIIFNQKLLSYAKTILGDEIAYTQHSDVHINLHAGGLHRDSAYRKYGVGPDWDESDAKYGVVRVAIYLQSHKDSGSSLFLLPGTNRRESILTRYECMFWNQLRATFGKFGMRDLLPHIFLTNKSRFIKTRAGDCVIFDQRVIHAGGGLRGEKPKYSLFLSFGKKNVHSLNHKSFYMERPAYTKKMPERLIRKLQKENLLLK